MLVVEKWSNIPSGSAWAVCMLSVYLSIPIFEADKVKYPL